ncbi:MAG: winged helix-turn-helix domain-containing protein [Anaerolineae bacterium]|nr:winged helix-turn-helix domain-containing protein [Anaerolineae bacterium]
MRRDVFQAIADPHRRAILELLARQNLTVNGVADHFAISRPAVSKHLKILTECGLVVMQRHGRERYCEVQPDKLNKVTDWLEQYQRMWEQRYGRLDELLHELQKKENQNDD